MARRIAPTELTAIVRGLDDAPRKLVEDATQVAMEAYRRRIRADTGGDGFLRNSRQRTAVDVEVTRQQARKRFASNTVEPVSESRYVLVWLEDGIARHEVGRARSGRGKRMRINGEWRTGPWSGGRMTARHTWSTGTDEATRAVHEVFGDAAAVVVHGK